MSHPERAVPGSGSRNVNFAIGFLGLLRTRPGIAMYYAYPADFRHVEMMAVLHQRRTIRHPGDQVWLTMDEYGRLGFGPFSSASECLGEVSQAKNAPTPKLH
jgi:hypothetical protein